MEVSFYPGCTAHSTGVEYSLSLHAVAEELGLELLEIEDWNCCGAAAAHSLSGLLGLALPARNLARAQERDLPLAVPCAGCYNALKRAQAALAGGGDMKEKLEEIVEFEYDEKLVVKLMHQVIMDQIGLEEVKRHIHRPLSGLKVASYYGCALVRSPEVVQMGDHENPLFLDEIVTLLGAEARDWSYKTDCCGADIAMTHSDIAVEIADRITDMALEAGADCAMVSCGLCQINLDMRQSARGRTRLPVFYFTELMGVAMDLPGTNKWWAKHVVDPRPLLKTLDLLPGGRR
ncbi:MAG: CoB--CoM heterodisulfide reductase iron-sulfur subunit B family protein [Spirochaetaceae bacterium]|nr:MAG: CoB--CoM heterodisulfide reductase iron-sulfur subunit B family protein [Spirochaetaceae bacterium]